MQISYTASQLCMLSQETVAPGAHRRKTTCQITRGNIQPQLHGTIRTRFMKEV